MTKLPVLSAHKVIKALGSAGFQVVSQKGSHINLKIVILQKSHNLRCVEVK